MSVLRPCADGMNNGRTWRCSVVCLALLVAACTSTSAARVNATSSVPVHTYAGGCAGTVLTDALPPTWAQDGWNHPQAPWGVPWARGTGGNAVAYLFATELVAGGSPRVDGTNNKVLWVAKGGPPSFTIEAHPLNAIQPVVTIAGGPSIVDIPTAGCWTFHLSWGLSGQSGSSTINLNVLPAGSAPTPITFQLLEARPLKLPTVASGSPCPTSPVSLLGGVAPRVGSPLRLGFGSTVGPEGAYAFNKTVLDFATPPLSPEVLLRGNRIDGSGKLYFGGSGVAPNQPVALSVAGPQGGQQPFYGELRLSVDGNTVFYTYPTSPGCYGIQADSYGFSEVIVFKAV